MKSQLLLHLFVFYVSPSSSNPIMTSPSSTSSPKGRRLHEILEEQQEPFFLDIYLLENGYSTRFLDEAPIMCWPGSDKRMLCKFTSSQFKKKWIEGFLRKKVLSKLPQLKYTKRDDDFGRNEEFENSERFCEKKIHKMDIKQLSPTSVFDLGSYKSSPVSQSEEEKPPKAVIFEPKILDIFKEFLETAYTPEFEKTLKPLDQNQPKRKQQYSVKIDNQERIWDSGGQILISEQKKVSLNVQKRQPDVFENHKLELEELRKKICKDIAETRRWTDFDNEIRGIAMEIEDAILEDIILDLYGSSL